MIRVFLLVTSFALTTSLFGQNEFSFDLMNQMDEDKNSLLSPTSIKAALAMAYEGANSTTQKEFEDVLGFDEENTEFLNELKQLKESAEISNSVWILDNYKVLPSYIETVKDRFDASPSYTDFKNDSEGSANKINAWIEESTNGMIKNMVTPESVKEFKMALVNAIYFKQDWKAPFKKSATKKKEFTNLDGTEVKVDMMRSNSRFRAFEGSKEKVIELPYDDDKTSMIIVLPNKMKGYKIDDASFTLLNAQLQWQPVNLELPKFTFETPTFEVKDMLKELGMKQAFSNSADFSGMREEKDLKIGTVQHKAKIIVNEEGTEAAAATVVGMVQTTSISTRPVQVMQFITDKPFYYFIKDKKTGSLLFMGKMTTME
ncbi:MAG: serpin family protein [bacterium]|nr:serpin family protein [bacterium]